MPIPAPTGPNNRSNDYYQLRNGIKLARVDRNRTEFFGTIGGIPVGNNLTLEDQGDGTSTVTVAASVGNIVLLDQTDGTSTIGSGVAPPVVSSAIEDQNLVHLDADTSINLATVFSGAAMTYSVTGTGASISLNNLVLSAATEVTSTIAVTATNDGGSVTDTFELTVAGIPVTLTAPIGNKSLVTGGNNDVIDLQTVFADATSYSVTGTGASVSVNLLTLSAASPLTNEAIAVSGINAYNTVIDNFTLTVAVSVPVLLSPIPNQNLILNGAGATLDLDVYFSGATSYSVTGTGASVSGPTGSDLTLDATTTLTNEVITVTATNASGDASDAFNLTVAAGTVPAVTMTPIVADELDITCNVQGTCYYAWYADGSTPSATDIVNGTGTGYVAASAGTAGTFTALATLDDVTIETTALSAATTYVLAIVVDINDDDVTSGYTATDQQDYTTA